LKTKGCHKNKLFLERRQDQQIKITHPVSLCFLQVKIMRFSSVTLSLLLAVLRSPAVVVAGGKSQVEKSRRLDSDVLDAEYKRICHDSEDNTEEHSIYIKAWPSDKKSLFEVDFTGTEYGDPNESQTIANGWCIDIDRSIGTGNYDFDIYSAYSSNIPQNGDLALNAVHNHDKLDSITWLMNNIEVGDRFVDLVARYDPDRSFDGSCNVSHGATTFYDIQGAIWQTIDGKNAWENNQNLCLTDYLQEIMEREGANYEPNCSNPDELVPLVLTVDTDGAYNEIINQVIVAGVKLSTLNICECYEENAPSTTSAPSVSMTMPEVNEEGGTFGDPHVMTWVGERYEYHGVCDLVFLQNPTFVSGLGMEIHIRTKKTKQWSYISNVAVRIGDETLEVEALPYKNMEETFWINGVLGGGNAKSLSGYELSLSETNNRQRDFQIMLNKEIGEVVSIKTFKDMVRVDIHKGSKTNFGKSLGLMGQYGVGDKLGRDGIKIIEEINIFGQEWQVLPTEDMLFHNVEGPQAPKMCTLPSASTSRRRLSDFTISLEDAERACSRVDPADLDTCVFDVMATNDADVAGAY